MLAILRKARVKDKEMRVLMLGLDNAGKTTIVKRLMNEDVHSVSPTLGFIIKTIDYKGWVNGIRHELGLGVGEGLTVESDILGDVGGQKTLRTYWRNYFEKTDALIWVVDTTDRLRMADCQAELAALLLEERLMGASVLIFANKTDVGDCMTNEEIREGLQLEKIKTHEWNIVRCSAVTGDSVQEGFDWVVQDAIKKLFLY